MARAERDQIDVRLDGLLALGADGVAECGVCRVELVLELAALHGLGLRISFRLGRRGIPATGN